VVETPADNLVEVTLAERQVQAMQRRTAVRYRCAVGTVGRLSLADRSESMDVVIMNLSETGIGLTLDRPLEKGAQVTIMLRGPAPDNAVVLPSRVMHATADSDGTWRVGCMFGGRLMPETLLELLG
jgi:hypothetical protein